MSRKYWNAIGVAAFSLFGGFAVFQACMVPGEPGAASLDGPMPGAIDPPPVMSLDGGPAEPSMPPPTQPGDPQQPDPVLPSEVCAGVTCAAGQICCPGNGSCVPADCADCCPFHEAEEPAPRVEVPAVEGLGESPVPPPEDPFAPVGPGPRPGVGAPPPGGGLPPPSPE